MTLEALESGRIIHASQDESREFIRLLACICANGTALPPALIYRGDSKTLSGEAGEIQDSILQNGYLDMLKLEVENNTQDVR